MLDPATKSSLIEEAYSVLRHSSVCRGKRDGDVLLLAKRIVEQFEMSGWEVTKRPPAPWHSTPGE